MGLYERCTVPLSVKRTYGKEGIYFIDASDEPAWFFFHCICRK